MIDELGLPASLFHSLSQLPEPPLMEALPKAVICPSAEPIGGFAGTQNFLWGYGAGSEDGLIRKWDFCSIANRPSEGPSTEKADPISTWPMIPRGSAPISMHSLAIESQGLWGLCGMGNGSINLFLTSRLHSEGTIAHRYDGKVGDTSFLHGPQLQPISSLCILGTSFLAGSWNGSIRLYDLDVAGKGEVEIHAGKNPPTSPNAFCNDSSAVHKSQICGLLPASGDSSSEFISTSVDGVTALWDLRVQPSASCVGCFRGKATWTFGCCWSRTRPMDTFYVAKRNGTIEEWSLTNDQQPIKVHKLPAESGPVTAIGCIGGAAGAGAQCDRIVACSLDATRIIETSTGAVNIVQGSGGGVVAGVTISEDDRFMVTSGGKRGWNHLTPIVSAPSTFYTLNKRM